MESKSFVQFWTKEKTYGHDIEFEDGSVLKAGTPIVIGGVYFSPEGSEDLAVAYVDDEEDENKLIEIMDRIPIVTRESKTTHKLRKESRYPVKVIYQDTEDPEVKQLVDIIELPPPKLFGCGKLAARLNAAK